MVNNHKSVNSVDIIEKFVQSKNGQIENCEDLIHISKNFIAVIDGATGKTNRKWDGKTGGQIAAQIIDQTLNQISGDYSVYQASQILTQGIKEFYNRNNIFEMVQSAPHNRISATLSLINLVRQEIWLLGDCQFIMDNQKFTNPLKIDSILANTRALCLELELAKGSTIDKLSKKDIGREFIMPLLEQQSFFQNSVFGGEYSYCAIDGFPIYRPGIIVQKIPKNVTIVILATDGYPILEKSLYESEKALQQILLKDPLLFRNFKSTKGLMKGNVSFDDRAFVKLRIKREKRR
jgi:hypothetical protein